MDSAQKPELTPSAKRLRERIRGILRASPTRKAGEKFIDDDVQSVLCAMTPAQMTELCPPSAEAGLWTNDNGFCRRLGAYVFGVPPEAVDELSWQELLYLIQIVTANFIKSLEGAIPS